MKSPNLLLSLLVLSGCAGPVTVRDQAQPVAAATATPPPAISERKEQPALVVFPAGSRLEPGDYSAVWGVAIRHHDIARAELDEAVVISAVHPGLPAGLSGVVEGATILKFNGRQIRNQTDLYNAIRALPFESTNIPFVQKLPNGEISEGVTFVIHAEITGLAYYFDQLQKRRP